MKLTTTVIHKQIRYIRREKSQFSEEKSLHKHVSKKINSSEYLNSLMKLILLFVLFLHT